MERVSDFLPGCSVYISDRASGASLAGIHYHSSFELLFISGEHTLQADGRAYPLSPGDVCLIGAGVYHYLTAGENAGVLSFIFTRGDAPPLSPERERVRVLRGDDLWALAEILRRGDARSALSRSAAETLLLLTESYCGGGNTPSAQGSFADEHLIDDYFSDRFSEKLTAAELAQILSLSTRQLQRVLYARYNKTFSEILADTRLYAAQDLLKNTALTVEDIAARVGYPQPSNFYRMFARKTGLTPGEWRAREGV